MKHASAPLFDALRRFVEPAYTAFHVPVVCATASRRKVPASVVVVKPW